MLQKARFLQIQGIKSEAVVLYRELLITLKMWKDWLSQSGKQQDEISTKYATPTTRNFLKCGTFPPNTQIRRFYSTHSVLLFM